MLRQVMVTGVKVSGTVPLGQFTLGEITRMEPGDLLELPPRALERVEVRASTDRGPAVITTAKLGTQDQNKALRLSEPPDERFLAPLRATLAERRSGAS
ncbi:MAG: FliM/FliN family flagellar motor C-terminal domain-containing protein, partial [Pseudomonadota bacterium]